MILARTKRCARAIGGLIIISLFIFINWFDKCILYKYFLFYFDLRKSEKVWRQILFSKGSTAFLKSVKFWDEKFGDELEQFNKLVRTLGQMLTQVVCDSHRFHGVKLPPNLSRSQILVQTIKIISDKRILNWKPKSILFENHNSNLKMFSHFKIQFFFKFQRPIN